MLLYLEPRVTEMAQSARIQKWLQIWCRADHIILKWDPIIDAFWILLAWAFLFPCGILLDYLVPTDVWHDSM